MGTFRNLQRAALLLVCAAIQGCGTDAFTLLQDDEELTWQAELALAEAGELPIEVERAYAQAAIEKTEACRPIYRSIRYRMERAVLGNRPSLLKSFGNDFLLLVSRIAPVGPMASCAAAYERYHAQYLVLRAHVDRDQTAY